MKEIGSQSASCQPKGIAATERSHTPKEVSEELAERARKRNSDPKLHAALLECFYRGKIALRFLATGRSDGCNRECTDRGYYISSTWNRQSGQVNIARIDSPSDLNVSEKEAHYSTA